MPVEDGPCRCPEPALGVSSQTARRPSAAGLLFSPVSLADVQRSSAARGQRIFHAASDSDGAQPGNTSVRPTVASSQKHNADSKAPHRFNAAMASTGVAWRKPGPGRCPVNDRVSCREMELLCRHRAALDPRRSWKWLGEADRWRDLARGEAHARHAKHPGPMAMGPNTIEGDCRNRERSGAGDTPPVHKSPR